VFFLLSFYFLTSFDSSFCLLNSSFFLLPFTAYADTLSDRELALPRHAQLRRRSKILAPHVPAGTELDFHNDKPTSPSSASSFITQLSAVCPFHAIGTSKK